MNSETLLKLVFAALGCVISLIALIGGYKEGKRSLEDLNKHLDEKEKHAHEVAFRQEAHQEM